MKKKTNTIAAVYLRSSKDRADASIASQRRELTALAEARQLTITKEYADAVESAKDEHRPAFQALIRDLKSRDRNWSNLLMIDTSRLSRRRFMAQVFKHECKKQGVTIIYSKLPDMDPITSVVVESVLEAFDEMHSLMSKEKGLAGMAENVRNGFRAGGRAPIGYKLKKIDTGAIREGQAVTKSVLELSDKAQIIKRYLTARAGGASRSNAAIGLDLSKSTLNGIEWNALTYAGHTVWNVHNEYEPGGYKSGTKRRPREEWKITENTHSALITTAQAESIINLLEKGKHGKRSRGGKYLLSGLLKAPDGAAWLGELGKYRYKPASGKGRYINGQEIEEFVIKQIKADWSGDELARKIMAMQHDRAEEDPCKDLRKELISLNQQISKTMDLAAKLSNPAPAIRKVDELESKRDQLAKEIEIIQKEYASTAALKNINPEIVKQLLSDKIDNLANSEDKERLKDEIHQLIEKVELCPETYSTRIYYRISIDADRVCMASPRESETIPIIRLLKTSFMRSGYVRH